MCFVDGGREGDGRLAISSIPSLHTFLPPCFGQMRKLGEEKEHSMNQVRELEASLAELRNQIGKLRLE